MSNEWHLLGYVGLGASLGGVLAFNLGFEWLHRLGGRFDRRNYQAPG